VTHGADGYLGRQRCVATASLLALFVSAGCEGGATAARDASRVEDVRSSPLDAQIPTVALDAQSRDASDAAPRDAGQPDPSAACRPSDAGAPPAWQTKSLLPRALDQNGAILTASIRHVHAAGVDELYVAEPLLHQITRLRDCNPVCAVSVLGDGLVAPVRTHVIDFDRDGDLDVLVADVGVVEFRPEKAGRIVWLENLGEDRYVSHVLLEGVGRIACAEAADLDADGDYDVTVCEFGASEGAIAWLEARDGKYLRHDLRRDPGAIHAFPFDADGDGDLDIAVALSQAAQEVLVYRNMGSGVFLEHRVFRADYEGFGLSSIELTDLDGDGNTDILVTGGDYLDESYAFEQQGVWLLHNDGRGGFAASMLAKSVGAYAVRSLDVDGDCDLDLVLASMRIASKVPDSLLDGSLTWLENDGALHFPLVHVLSGAPPSIATLEAIAREGRLDVFTGTFGLGAVRESDVRLLRLSSVAH
jgi:FG-GAP-like repeat